jgi:hypothetical protein
MKFVSKLMIGAFIALNTVSCSKNDDGTANYDGENRVYITAAGDKTLTIGEENQKIEAKITLTTRVNAPMNLRLKAVDTEGKASDLVVFSSNPITIAKEAREASVTIMLKKGGSLTAEKRLKITFEADKDLTAKEDLDIVVKPSLVVASLTPAQRLLLEGYKAKGMDLWPFIGKVKVQTVIHSSAGGTTETFATAFDRTYQGQTVISLSEKATEARPILKMTDNPMGLTEFLYFLLKKNTIEDNEYFLEQPDPKAAMTLLKWNKVSQEIFKVSLDNIKIETPTNGISKITYIAGVQKDEDTTIQAVPFQMEYTAWERLQTLAKQNNEEAKRLLAVDGTSNPQHYINNDNILTDEYGVGNWKASSGNIDFAKKTMTFEFLVYHTYSNGYVQVKVTYTAQ